MCETAPQRGKARPPQSQEVCPSRHALARRAHERLARQLRPTAAQHRPDDRPSAHSDGPGDHLAHHGEAHRLAQPLEPALSAYPRNLLTWNHVRPAARTLERKGAVMT